jgi:hypothetical protein
MSISYVKWSQSVDLIRPLGGMGLAYGWLRLRDAQA